MGEADDARRVEASADDDAGGGGEAPQRRLSPTESDYSNAINLSVLSEACGAPLPSSAFGGALRAHVMNLRWTAAQAETLLQRHKGMDVEADVGPMVDDLVEALRAVVRVADDVNGRDVAEDAGDRPRGVVGFREPPPRSRSPSPARSASPARSPQSPAASPGARPRSPTPSEEIKEPDEDAPASVDDDRPRAPSERADDAPGVDDAGRKLCLLRDMNAPALPRSSRSSVQHKEAEPHGHGRARSRRPVAARRATRPSPTGGRSRVPSQVSSAHVSERMHIFKEQIKRIFKQLEDERELPRVVTGDLTEAMDRIGRPVSARFVDEALTDHAARGRAPGPRVRARRPPCPRGSRRAPRRRCTSGRTRSGPCPCPSSSSSRASSRSSASSTSARTWR